MPDIAGVRPPDSPLCSAAAELARRVSPTFLFHHVMRSWVYAAWLGEHRGLPYDPELLYVATVLHDLGLTRLAPVQGRFEVEGADAAKEFLARQGMAERSIEIVWDAIALHTTAEIPLRKAPEIALCHLGIAHDLRALPDFASSGALRERALAAYPRLDLSEGLLGTLVRLYHTNPAAAASHAVADACERRVAGFRRFNLCDILLSSEPESTPRAP